MAQRARELTQARARGRARAGHAARERRGASGAIRWAATRPSAARRA